jgi:hypothetical protein
VQIWERRRRIPSTTYNDPLDHIFTEFDEDGDGHLTSEEIATALKSRNVEITPDQIKEFIRGESAACVTLLFIRRAVDMCLQKHKCCRCQQLRNISAGTWLSCKHLAVLQARCSVPSGMSPARDLRCSCGAMSARQDLDKGDACMHACMTAC